jgi:signal transduction histidine kinase
MSENVATTQPLPAIVPRISPRALLLSAEPWKSALFLVSSFVFGLVSFVALVTLIATGIGLIVTVVGIPLLAATMLLWPYLARLERHRVRALAGVDIPSPYRPMPEGNLIDKGKAIVADGAVWRDLAYLLLLFPIGIAELAVVWNSLYLPYVFLGNARLTSMTLAGFIVNVGIALCILGLAPYAFTLVTRAHARLALWLLGPSDRSRLEERIETLTRTRSRMVDVAFEERRAIERDLHDGAQQRLVALALDLGMAREKLESDPEASRALVDSAHEQAKLALTDIRDLVRGIHPAVLTDRGLDAAISALTGQCPVPVTVDVTLPERPPEAVETTAYFIVAEALTNVAKHSGATEAHVVVHRANGSLMVNVIDDGQGGAAIAPGGGLAGLEDRVAALDGTFDVTSPSGGPTRVRAVIPCES